MALTSPAIVNIFRSSSKVIDVSSKKNVLSSASSLSRHKNPKLVTQNKLFHSFSNQKIPKFVYNDDSKRFTSSAAKQKRYCFYIFLCNYCVILLICLVLLVISSFREKYDRFFSLFERSDIRPSLSPHFGDFN